MKKKYSQIRALYAISKASLTSSFSNISNVFFSILFPIVFIIIFGVLDTESQKLVVGVDENCNTDNLIFQTLDSVDEIDFKKDYTPDEMSEKLEKGDLAAILQISPKGINPEDGYDVNIKTSKASLDSGNIFVSMVNGVVDKINLKMANIQNPAFQVTSEVLEGRKYRSIDFVLPGMLSFSLLSSGIFATTFTFINLRNTLVIKRFMATPSRKINTVLGIGISRLAFSIMQVTIIISMGALFLNFTMVNGFVTFINMMIMAVLGLIVFLGFGFLASNIAKREQTAHPIANLFTSPQMLLGGVFFPIDLLPEWVQPISNALPLAYLSNAMRDISFEGASLLDVQSSLIGLSIWAIVIYVLVVKTFRWEAD